MDTDPVAVKIARKRLEDYRDSSLFVNENFANLQATCTKYDFFPVHGILLDLGLSSLQLNGNGRGFSFQHDAKLDMRFDPEQETTAADIVNKFTEDELAHLMKTYGEENYSHRIARNIIRERPIKTTLHLARVVEQATGRRRGKIHPATKTFQALRIAVNHELENLEAALRQAVELLGCEGRLVVISYHSLEDRMVKQFMQRESRDCICPPGLPTCVCGHQARLRLVNRRVITPSEQEVQRNPRSRSARLRSAARTCNPGDCYAPAEGADFLYKTEAVGWRRPALLQKIKMVFLAG
jgi:16S rRNA (cytosine1402-N4)-methyltransferase